MAIENLGAVKFIQTVQSPELSVIVFGADWCSPCGVVKNEIEKLSIPGVRFFYVDLNKNRGNPDAANMKKMVGSITGIPNIVYFQGGKILDRFAGEVTAEAMHARITKLLSQ